jgi:enoyl-CoA hydratase/carnithine racemase
LATNISTQHPVAIRTMLQTIRQRQDDGLEQTLQREALAQAICYNRDDWGEGVNAIAEKRDTVFDPYHKK